MKASYNWLKDYVDIKLKPKELADKLTMAGLEVTSIENMGDDAVMEFEITPNRPDCLSVIGIAREVAAVTKKKLKTPALLASLRGRSGPARLTALASRRSPLGEAEGSRGKPWAGRQNAKVKTRNPKLKTTVEIKDKDLCPFYTARIIEGVKIGHSPKWLVERLEKMRLRPVNNVVDITNFVLFETGQPLHAFDFDKLNGKKIIVRRAKKDEKIVTIDGDERALSGDMLVIADLERPVALGGVMGSLNSEVTASTKNILLESAYFNPVSIRRTSRRLGLMSESSYRFERSVDIGGVIAASDRAAELIVEHCGGRIGPVVKRGAAGPEKKDISLRLSRLNTILGSEISASEAKKILLSLQIKVKGGAKDKLSISVPSFRQDLKSEIDIVEEVARIYGYDKFASTLAAIQHERKKKKSEFDFAGCERNRLMKNLIRDRLVSSGVNEIITYSLISRKLLEGMDDIDSGKIVSVKNPLSSEQETMRPTLIAGMLNTLSTNLNRKIRDQKLFELGKVYFKENKEFVEKEFLAVGMMGRADAYWLGGRMVNVLYLKGIVESVFETLGVHLTVDIDKIFPVVEKRVPFKAGSEEIGYLEDVSEEILQRFDIKEEVVIAHIDISKIIPLVKLEVRFSEITKFPSATRDLSVIVDEIIFVDHITSIIKKTGGDLVKKVELFDYYKGQQIPDGKKGLAYSVEYQADNRTLTNEEVNDLHAKIAKALTLQLSAQIR